MYKDQVVIVSNSAGTPDDKDGRQAKDIESALKVHVLRHQQKKPSGGEELLKHFHGISAERIAFVGDRALTDVVFGNNHGMFTILTKNVVTEDGDNPMAVWVCLPKVSSPVVIMGTSAGIEHVRCLSL